MDATYKTEKDDGEEGSRMKKEGGKKVSWS